MSGEQTKEYYQKILIVTANRLVSDVAVENILRAFKVVPLVQVAANIKACRQAAKHFLPELILIDPFVGEDVGWHCPVSDIAQWTNSKLALLSGPSIVHQLAPGVKSRIIAFDWSAPVG